MSSELIPEMPEITKLPLSTLRLAEPFSLNASLECGQFFQWERLGNGYVVQRGAEIFYIRQEDEFLAYSPLAGRVGTDDLIHFFRLDDDLVSIFNHWSDDALIRRIYHKFRGLRILRQDPWECTLSFLCSMASNIPRITRNLKTLARQYGTPVETPIGTFYRLPSPEELNEASLEDLYAAGLGFRAKYISGLLPAMRNGFSFQMVASQDYYNARDHLTAFHGIGEKIADCVQLFSLDYLEAFPVDTWIRQVLHRYYFSPEIRSPRKLGTLAREHFGAFGGYAQQYLFHAAKSGALDL